MERREAIKRTSLILQSALLAPGVMAAWQACTSDPARLQENYQVLTSKQVSLVNAIADTIIPETDTPSASGVKVTPFIDLLLLDVLALEAKEAFLKGLDGFDKTCKTKTNKSFVELSEQEQIRYLEGVDKAVLINKEEEEQPFYATFKRLVVSVYFSSEQGVKQNLNYVPVPGPYQPVVIREKDAPIMQGNNI
jgi:hypothetical protein